MYEKHIKRMLDLLLSIVGLLVLIPIFLIIIIIIKLDSRGPVFFRQKRVGKDKMYFYILKFRTMKVSAPTDCPTHLLRDSNIWITKFGRFLRNSSLDELPQLINILYGQMSLVGPRPALWNQMDLIEEREKYDANSIRPGLTGWAQINGRDEIKIEQKASLDGYYRKNISFLMDIQCIGSTFINILKKEGIREGDCDENTNSRTK